jgi:hypothetical protein
MPRKMRLNGVGKSSHAFVIAEHADSVENQRRRGHAANGLDVLLASNRLQGRSDRNSQPEP